MQNVNHIKERIVSIIQHKGPSLPVQIASTINVAPMFSSVFLSELYGDKKVLMSNMKVGSSPLYFLPGQEPQLENFIEHLNQREKEAFFLLKKEIVLEDSKQTPIIRVALRAIKDFAIPFRIEANNEHKSFWRFFLVSEQDALEKLAPQKRLKDIPKPEEKVELEIKPPEEKSEKPKPENRASVAPLLKEFILSKNLEIMESLVEKKKEAVHKVRTDSSLGKQSYYLVFKDKKKITETDLTLILQKAQAEKMPAILISTGSLDKKAQEYLKSWKELLKFEKFPTQS
ncbi:MAG: hypothetical protein MUF61_03565 [archaeon]|jgi:hypothetical protein|nr:hypothetical protein [archaeon]